MPSESLMQKMQAKLRQLESQQNKKVVMKEGINRLRILPSWRGPDEDFFLEVLTHYDVTPDVRYLICPMTVGEECPVDRRVARWSQGDSQQQARAERVAAKSQYLMNVIPIIEGVAPEVKLYAAPRTVLFELLSFFTDSEYGDFTDPKEGFDVLINRKGKDLNTRYTVRLARQPSRVRLKDWKSHLIDIDREYRPRSSEEIRRLLGSSGNGSDASAERRPKRREREELPERRPRRPRQEEMEEDDIPF